jgi:hypothetical protein
LPALTPSPANNERGKVRYLGFSDAPGRKVAQAQVISHFRGWAPLIGRQIEYSLMERTVEGELSKPVLNFPADFNANRSTNFGHAGATVDGVPSTLLPNVPAEDSQRY